MNRSIHALVLAVALPVAGLVFAQTAAPSGSTSPVITRSAPSPQLQQLYRGTLIIGTAVRDSRDRQIGEIKDLLLDGGRGEVAYAVVSFRGATGGARKWHAVPWLALEPGDSGKYYVLRADRETLSQAPGFDMAKWPDMADPNWSAETDRYWSRMVGRGAAGNNRLTSGASGASGTGNARDRDASGQGAGPRSDMDSSGR